MLSVGTLSCAGPNSPAREHEPEPVDSDTPSPEQSAELSLPCESCSLDCAAETPSLEPSICSSTITSVSKAEALALGYDVDAFVDLVQGDFSAPVRWHHADREPTTLSASITVTSYELLEKAARNGDVDSLECKDALLVGVRTRFETADGGLSGTLEGHASIGHQEERVPPLRVGVYAWNNQLRGNLTLQTGSLGPPLALRMSFDALLVSNGESRLGLELFGLYEDSCEFGFAQRLEQAKPLDDCPAFALAQGDECVEVMWQ